MIIYAFLMLAQPAASNTAICDQDKADQGIQSDMNICAAAEFRAANKAMNDQFKLTFDSILDREAAIESEKPADDDAGYVENFLKGHVAWRKYRDAHCASEGIVAAGGSIEPLLVATCKTALAEGRTKQLRELAREF